MLVLVVGYIRTTPFSLSLPPESCPFLPLIHPRMEGAFPEDRVDNWHRARFYRCDSKLHSFAPSRAECNHFLYLYGAVNSLSVPVQVEVRIYLSRCVSTVL